jgi:hypothetical protein
MDKNRLKKIGDRWAKATPGPWHSGKGDHWGRSIRGPVVTSGPSAGTYCDVAWIGKSDWENDAEFIEHSKEDISMLLDLVDKQADAIKELSKLINTLSELK